MPDGRRIRITTKREKETMMLEYNCLKKLFDLSGFGDVPSISYMQKKIVSLALNL